MNKHVTDDVARPRLRAVITTALLLLISVMIVRDIFVRRWTPPTPDTTQHSR